MTWQTTWVSEVVPAKKDCAPHDAGTTISMFLFGNAHEEHFRESEGSVVAIFSARTDTDQKGKLSLKVFEPEAILKLGISADFAYCGSKTKVHSSFMPPLCCNLLKPSLEQFNALYYGA